MAAKLSNSEREQAARVVALFSALIHAWRTNHFSEAASATDELAGLGIEVRIRRRLRMDGANA